MRLKRSIRQIAIAVLAVFIIAGVSLVDSSAQRRRRRHRSRPSAPRITNPAIYQPSPSDNANSNSEELIPAGSRPEQEIRGCALHAVECVREALANGVTSMELDYVLWNRGQQPEYKAQPRHRTRSPARPRR